MNPWVVAILSVWLIGGIVTVAQFRRKYGACDDHSDILMLGPLWFICVPVAAIEDRRLKRRIEDLRAGRISPWEL